MIRTATVADLQFDEAWMRPLPVQVSLVYQLDDPCAVRMRFRARRGGSTETIEWTVSRDLLRAGLIETTPQGHGDVTAHTVEDGMGLEVSLSSPDGAARFRFPHNVVSGFIDSTIRRVPADGGEMTGTDWDTELAVLLGTDS